MSAAPLSFPELLAFAGLVNLACVCALLAMHARRARARNDPDARGESRVSRELPHRA